MRTVDVAERRARLGARHHLATEHRARDVVHAASSLVCLHATDPATVYLSAWARTTGFTVDDMDRALYADRSLIKHLAMRRTLFVFPRETVAVAQSAVSNKVAERERRRLIADVETAGLHKDGERWLADASEQVLSLLADGREATSRQLRAEIPLLEGSIMYGEGRAWGGMTGIGPRVLTTLSAAGRIVRGSNDGRWAVSRPRWSSMRSWLDEGLLVPPESEAVARLVELWLRAFGPGTELDIKWWLGSTLSAVRKALREIDAVEVDLGGTTGYLLPDDLGPTERPAPWAALLPPLDPTTMGWAERAWYLGAYKDQLFDTAGNAGPTMWWHGRIVGGWRQRENGDVELQPLESISPAGRRALREEAERLSEWFGGVRVMPRFPSPLSKALADDALPAGGA